MKNKGFGLFELVVCMSFIFVILVQFTELSLTLYETNSNLMKENNTKNNIYNLYKEIGYDFLTYNIKEIKKEGNIYKFKYYRHDENILTEKTLQLDSNNLIYNDNKYPYYLNSDKNFEIQNMDINYENNILKLSIKINDEVYDFICSNKIGSVNI